MLNKSENYKYIWSVLQQYLEDEEKRQQLKFVIPENRIAAYLELNNDNISDNDIQNNEIAVNPFLRFDGLVFEKTENETKNELLIKEIINNLYFHLFANIDLHEGQNMYDIVLYFIIKNVENGEFGENVKRYFKYFHKKEKRIVAKYIKKYYEEDQSFNVFLRVFKEIFKDSIVYKDKLRKRNFILYINENKNEENKMKVRLLISLFIPIEYKVKIMWEYHVGVIDVEETLNIDEMTV